MWKYYVSIFLNLLPFIFFFLFIFFAFPLAVCKLVLVITVSVVVAFPIFWSCMWPIICFPHCTHCCSQPISDFGGQCVSECYLPVSGPLDFCLVTQVLKRPCMILNTCVHRRHPCLTFLVEDVVLPQGSTSIPTAPPETGIKPGSL